MSATKPPAGYDDRFVVPLEPSRRGAHRARVSPVIGVLPLVAVVAVVLVVVMLTWSLFGRSADTSAGAGAAAGNTPVATQTLQTAQPTPSDTVSTPVTTSSDPTSSATDGAVDKTVDVVVLNSTTRAGLAGRAATALVDQGWTAAHSAKTPKVTARMTTVYYATTSQKAAATALAEDLGLGAVKKSTQFGSAGLTVVVGTDYP